MDAFVIEDIIMFLLYGVGLFLTIFAIIKKRRNPKKENKPKGKVNKIFDDDDDFEVE